MEHLAFKLNPNLFVRDPQTTELGQRIIKESIRQIDKLGFEQFNFKRLAMVIKSTEASIYRYFENKHRLLVYLIDWFWNWIEYKIDLYLMNITDPREKLHIVLKILVEEKSYDDHFAFVDERLLQKIVTTEFEKTYHTKHVDADNREGLFLPYKKVCKKIALIVKEINPSYPFPHSLVSTVLLSANHQLYYAEHLPSLSDIKSEAKTKHQLLLEFIENMMLNTLRA